MKHKGFWGIFPLVFFLIFYVTSSVIAGDFTKTPVITAFFLSTILAVCLTRGLSLADRIRIFGRGAGTTKMMFIVWIFLIAGAFAESANQMGCISETANFIVSALPPQYIYVSIFVAGCFISMATGSGLGSIIAVAPIGVEVAQQLGTSMPFMCALVVCSAMFGDNLSFISDTTVVATATQGCELKDKFYTNIWIVVPAMVVLLIIYMIDGQNVPQVEVVSSVQYIKVLPYVVVLAMAIGGADVLLTLSTGAFLCGIEGMALGEYDFYGWMGAVNTGMANMGSLVILVIMSGGFMALIQHNGGIDFLVRVCTKAIRGRRSAEAWICMLTVFMCICTSVNTVAIINVAPVAKSLSERFGLSPKRVASLMDTSSCITQELMPYSTHLLTAAAFGGITAVSLIPYCYYAYLLAGCVILSVIFNIPKGIMKEQGELCSHGAGSRFIYRVLVCLPRGRF